MADNRLSGNDSWSLGGGRPMGSRNRFLRIFTHEGGRARRSTPEQELRRSLMNCMLWEDQFYEDGVTIAERMAKLVPAVAPETAAALAVEAREGVNLPHAGAPPL